MKFLLLQGFNIDFVFNVTYMLVIIPSQKIVIDLKYFIVIDVFNLYETT